MQLQDEAWSSKLFSEKVQTVSTPATRHSFATHMVSLKHSEVWKQDTAVVRSASLKEFRVLELESKLSLFAVVRTQGAYYDSIN